VICCCASLAITLLLARRLFRSSRWALLAVVMVGLNYSFSVYGTGGLETSLQTMLVMLAAHLAQLAVDRERPRVVDYAGYSVVAALALMTRLDSAVLLVAPAAALAWRLFLAPSSPGATPTRPRLAVALVAPAAVILGAWFAWKLATYGALFPLTFDVKTGGHLGPTLRQGARFVFEFARSYWLLPQILLFFGFAARLMRVRGLPPLMITCLLWLIYVVRVGGDFMEFRMMVPLVPFWSLCVLAVPALCLRRRRLAWATAGLIVVVAWAGSRHHQKSFKYLAGIESVRGLSRHLTAQRWVLAGEVLGEVFRGHEDEVTIAVTASGAIPYHSRLRTIDMLGLSDPVVAREGIPYKTQPGHERTASFHYLMQRGVNLVVGHPQVVSIGKGPDPGKPMDARSFRLIDVRNQDLPATARIVEIPLDREAKLLALYLVPHPLIDQAIRQRAWPTHGIP
jgi:arabinofuranosyltransferase